MSRAPERRSVPEIVRFHDRRSGYDRRKRYLLTGAIHRDALALAVLLMIINALSVLDFVFTYQELRLNVAREANPLLAALLSQNPGAAWAVKTGAMLLVTWGIWRERDKRAVLGTAVFAAVAYLALTGYHILGAMASRG